MDIHIRQDEITKYMWERLVVLGYAPSADEILDLSEIVLLYLTQFLIDNDIIQDVEFVDEVEENE